MCDVTVFKTKAKTVAYLRGQGNISEQPKMWKRLANYVFLHGLTMTGPGMAIYYDPVWNPENATYELCFPVNKTAEPEGEMGIKELPVFTVASLIHRGPYENLCETYKKLTDWIKDNGYKIIGPAMEDHLRCPHVIDDPRGYITDVQFPIARSEK